MNSAQWDTLLKVINGEELKERPIGFIIDSPWIPGWYHATALDYFADADLWFNANLKALNEFPEVIFLPGFWSEFGMCTEPSAFGSKLVWSEANHPHPAKILEDYAALANLKKPNVATDGLLPLALKRLSLYDKKIKASGHKTKFAVSRGPHNIASFLFGTTELMLGMAMAPDEVKKGLDTITDFINDWLTLQMETMKDIDGILILDDIIGFLGDADFKAFVLPYMKKIYGNFDVKVKFLHNDAAGLVCAPYLNEIGINLFNFSFNHSFKDIKELTDNKVTLLGNLPPRDVLAAGSEKDVRAGVREMMSSIEDHSRIIWSCGGGMPPDVETENIRAFITAVKEYKK
jgi:uroporphyrinogen-III decarboxylase